MQGLIFLCRSYLVLPYPEKISVPYDIVSLTLHLYYSRLSSELQENIGKVFLSIQQLEDARLS